MSGATNCPETPRQKMIGMMYLVLTAMLALNVSADVLNGFTIVDTSMQHAIESADLRNAKLYNDMQYLYEQNPAKVGEWLEKSNMVKAKSDSLFNLLQDFRKGVFKLADGDKADPEFKELQEKSNTDIGAQYAGLNQPGINRGKELQKAIEDYREFIIEMFDHDSMRTIAYNQIFYTGVSKNSHGENVDWLNANFESMPAAAVITLLSKYQNDVRAAESQLIQYFKIQQDAGDFRVNKIEARLIPNSKSIIQGGKFHAEIALMAVDTTKTPVYYVNGKQLENEIIDISCPNTGSFPIKGSLEITDHLGNKKTYSFEDEYSVSAPTATIANTDMNAIYRGYENKLEISVPGVPSDKIKVQAEGASIEKKGNLYICKPGADSKATKVAINVSAEIDGKLQAMGRSEFRVLTLPSPTAFLLVNGEPWQPGKKVLKRREIYEAPLIAQYEDGLLKADFRITGFTMVINNKGSMRSETSTSNKFTQGQKDMINNAKSGATLYLQEIKYEGAKSGKLTFPPITLP